MLYSILSLLFLPIFAFHRFRQKLKQTSPAAKKGHHDIWLHAASLGEVTMAAPLLEALLSRKLRVVLTTNTATGMARAISLAQGLPAEQLSIGYAPFDTHWHLHGFLEKFSPKALVTLEAELWRNWCIGCSKRGMPIILANARLSEKSLRLRSRLAFTLPPAAHFPNLILATTQEDLANYKRLWQASDGGLAAQSEAPEFQLCGNLKFATASSALPARSSYIRALEERLAKVGGEKRIWVAASTHEPEEELLLDARAQSSHANLLLLAPRHPQRFKEVADILERRKLKFIRLSALAKSSERLDECQVLLLDTMGDLPNVYPLAGFAYVGGSFSQHQGHNILEVLRHSRPVLLGPHHYNLKSILPFFVNKETKDTGKHQAVTILQDKQELRIKLDEFLALAPAKLEAMAVQAKETIFAQKDSAQELTARILHQLKRGTGPHD